MLIHRGRQFRRAALIVSLVVLYRSDAVLEHCRGKENDGASADAVPSRKDTRLVLKVEKVPTRCPLHNQLHLTHMLADFFINLY